MSNKKYSDGTAVKKSEINAAIKDFKSEEGRVTAISIGRFLMGEGWDNASVAAVIQGVLGVEKDEKQMSFMRRSLARSGSIDITEKAEKKAPAKKEKVKAEKKAPAKKEKVKAEKKAPAKKEKAKADKAPAKKAKAKADAKPKAAAKKKPAKKSKSAPAERKDEKADDEIFD